MRAKGSVGMPEPLELTVRPLKHDGWKTTLFLLKGPVQFQGRAVKPSRGVARQDFVIHGAFIIPHLSGEGC